MDQGRQWRARVAALLDVPPAVKLGGAAATGVVVGLVLQLGSAAAALLGGWAAAGTIFVVWTLAAVTPMDAQATAAHALREEPARAIERLVVFIAAGASLAGLVAVLMQGGLRSDPAGSAAVLAAVVASWGCIHTLFALRYARLYYTAPEGGIDFHLEEGGAPTYTDFTYVAFTVGMSFAISDTDLRTTTMRRAAQAHALVSYLYGTVIVALLVGLIGGLAS
jgi:uncharacterized membrane protein